MNDPTRNADAPQRARGILALDFDGTIVDHLGQVSARTIRSLAEVAEQGWVVVGATGRPASLCAPVLSQVGSMGYLVASNGAEVFRVGEPHPVFSTEIAPGDARAAMGAIRSRWPAVGFCVGCLDGTQRWEPGFVEVVPVPPLGDEVANIVTELYEPVRTVVVFGEPIQQLGPDAARNLHEAVAATVPNLAVSDSGLGLPEIRPRAVSKASALEALRQFLCIEASETIAFGDGENDQPMLRWAHRGIAMAGANDATRLIADERTGPVEADGVAAWLERYLLTA